MWRALWMLLGAGEADAAEPTGPHCPMPRPVADDGAAPLPERAPPLDARKPAHTETAVFALG